MEKVFIAYCNVFKLFDVWVNAAKNSMQAHEIR